jgi:hypothetical protein
MLSLVRRTWRSNHRSLFISLRRYEPWQKRTLITESIEPPIVSKVPEKPCTFVLLEDQGLYPGSWGTLLRDCLPSKHGIHFCHQYLNPPNMKEALHEMKQDLASFPAIVLMARGPTVSLLAQYYLESLPLAGLIMVDPIVEPLSSDFLDSLQTMYSLESIRERAMLQSLQMGIETRNLKLEAGVIPMFVVSTIPSMEDQSLATVFRHNNPNSPHGEVHFSKLIEIEKILPLVIRWIEDIVL